ncbi:unnamed protein product [Moneuplotes crassus]|uniref:Uncharacterized protein n=1 Tax=Euplotes crassus TaxID=5936 RepID=A0AAD1XRY3_EUPCR|nr:unnamed protein product [Moneuplotes crassus]
MDLSSLFSSKLLPLLGVAAIYPAAKLILQHNKKRKDDRVLFAVKKVLSQNKIQVESSKADPRSRSDFMHDPYYIPCKRYTDEFIIQVISDAFYEILMILFERETSLRDVRMKIFNQIGKKSGFTDQEYQELINIQLEIRDNLFNRMIGDLSKYLNKKKSDLEKLKSTEEYWQKTDEAYQRAMKKQKQLLSETVQDSLSLIEAQFSDYRLKEMDEYIKDTERMIFTSFMQRPEFETRKAFQKEFLKSMIIRSDEFYKKYSFSLEYMEAYFKYTQNE